MMMEPKRDLQTASLQDKNITRQCFVSSKNYMPTKINESSCHI